MENKYSNNISRAIIFLGISIISVAYIHWGINKNSLTFYGWMASLLSAVLASAVFIKFVPHWMNLWSKDCYITEKTKEETADKRIYIKLSACAVLYCIAVFVLIFFIRQNKGYSATFAESINVWLSTDAQHFTDIAKEWYFKEGIWDRLVQLVFLPGYPIVVKLFALVFRNYLYSGIIVSVIAFAASCCMLYKLVLLDASHCDAVRAVKYLFVFPASFFFAGPMTESLFLLMCLCCIYCIRTKKWLLGGIFGGYAAFTRSLGITMFALLVIELVKDIIDTDKDKLTKKSVISKTASILLLPAGFGVYCVINYIIAGDFFKFLEYQRVHWSQNFGWFFSTASYQTELVLSNIGQNKEIILGLWLPNVVMQFISLMVMFLAVKKIRASYTGWFIGYYTVAIGCTWLLSGPRYLAGFAAMPIALSAITKNKTADIIATICCVLLNIAYLYVFSVRWYVW